LEKLLLLDKSVELDPTEFAFVTGKSNKQACVLFFLFEQRKKSTKRKKKKSQGYP
jgi:hypothetical protein